MTSRARIPLPLTVPRHAHGILGPITVRRPPKVTLYGAACLGSYLIPERRIDIERGLEPGAAIRTFYHELAHSWLHDSGIDTSGEWAESVCDAVALGMFAYLHRKGLA